MEKTDLFRWNRQNNGALNPGYIAFKSSYFFPWWQFADSFMLKNSTKIDDNAELKNISDHIWFPHDFCRIWNILRKEK